MTDTVLVLAHAHDAGASGVSQELARLGASVHVVRPESLGLATWSHRVATNGESSTRLSLPGGACIESDGVPCIFNRLQYLPVPRFHRSTPKDREYAGAELQALVASWLLSFGSRVINPVGPRGQSRGPLMASGWLALAARAGLPVARVIRTTAGRMLPRAERGERNVGFEWPGGVRGPAPAAIMLDGEVCRSAGSVLIAGTVALGSLCSQFGEPCLDLARRGECTLLEISFVQSDNGPVVSAVDPMPPLLEGWAVDAVADLLSRSIPTRVAETADILSARPQEGRLRVPLPREVENLAVRTSEGPGRPDVGDPSDHRLRPTSTP